MIGDIATARVRRDHANAIPGYPRVYIVRTFKGFQLIGTDHPAGLRAYGEPVE